MQMKLEELTQRGWENTEDYFFERDRKYNTFEMTVPEVIQLYTEENAVTPATTPFGDRMECLDIVSGISQMP